MMWDIAIYARVGFASVSKIIRGSPRRAASSLAGGSSADLVPGEVMAFLGLYVGATDYLLQLLILSVLAVRLQLHFSQKALLRNSPQNVKLYVVLNPCSTTIRPLCST